LDSIGYALHHLGRYQEAQTYLGRALELARQLGNRYTEAVVLEHLGDNHFATGDRTGARKIWGLASEILTDIGSPEAHRLRIERL
jgi:tetratricopeptide (TPR) repeat protein